MPFSDIGDEYLWMVIVGLIIAFILALGLGANDVANTFGTSVGAKVLTLRQACILASIFETLGAVLIGSNVSETMRKGIVDIEPYKNDTELLVAGNLAALSGSCIWLFTATFMSLPVSATHSMVGATIGYSLVAKGTEGIGWKELGKTVGSWFVSPVFSGCISTILFFIIKKTTLDKEDPLEPGLFILPFFYMGCLMVNLFSITYDGPEMISFDHIPLWGAFVVAIGGGILAALLVRIFIVPRLRRRIIAECAEMREQEAESQQDKARIEPLSNGSSVIVTGGKVSLKSQFSHDGNIIQNGATYTQIVSLQDEKMGNGDLGTTLGEKHPNAELMIVAPEKNNDVDDTDSRRSDSRQSSTRSKDSRIVIQEDTISTSSSETSKLSMDILESRENIEDEPEQVKIFSFLQILTAMFGAFVHGGNDVSNAIGPLITIWLVSKTGEVEDENDPPIWILFYGGVGISVGLFIWGRRVIETIGSNLTKVTPSSGVCIEIGSAFTVLLASNFGIPISSTHAQVGSVVFVGRFRSQKNVDWSLFRNIVIAWVLTLPATMGLAAAFMAALRPAVQ